ncbi:hypothetical protein ACQPZX_16435 [Actinoplanes sp. CA-142083]|uniref:hypothetical protein n=1 Tax=Actinoplanes sp. CA-142083 TaxID=3239903 RepID=UPI003D916F87
MSIRRVLALAAVLTLVGGCDRLDSMFQQRSEPRLLAGGAVGEARWSVVQVREKDHGECLELRSRGVPASHTCATSSLMSQYTLDIAVLHGTSQPLVFGLLPAGTARAEVALDGGLAVRATPGRKMAEVAVVKKGDLRFVAEPAPAGRTGDWKDGGSVNVVAYDEQDKPIPGR